MRILRDGVALHSEFHILTGMFSRPSFSTRSLALLLPVALLWVFAACVLSCSEKGKEDPEHGPSASVSVESLMGADDCDGCSLTKAVYCALPGRQAYFGKAKENAVASAPSILLNVREAHTCRSRLLIPAPVHAPPLEGHGVLRI